MKTKQVNRYTCDFCGKKGYSASHMTKHETHCTKNPKRVCGVCQMDWSGNRDQAPMADLVACLPDHPRSYYEIIVQDGEPFRAADYGIRMPEAEAEIKAALPRLREVSGNCPACILAALRQRNIPVWMATDFNFKKEMESIWNDINKDKRDRYGKAATKYESVHSD